MSWTRKASDACVRTGDVAPLQGEHVRVAFFFSSRRRNTRCSRDWSSDVCSSDLLYPLVNEANGSGVVWAVLNPAYTRLAMQQLAPEVGQFPEAAKLVARMQNMIINVEASSGIEGKFQAVCGSTDDANTLGQLLQAGFLYKRYQAQKDNPDLAQLLDQARVTPAGDRVTLRMSLSNDQMTSLIRKNTFALKM